MSELYLLQDTCLPEGSSRPQAYFDNTQSIPNSNLLASTIYQPCHPLCLSCTGFNSTDCQSCRSSFITSTQNGPITECVDSCSSTNSDPGIFCQSCNSECGSGCSGSTNQDCADCQGGEILLDGQRTCIDECTMMSNQYPARISNSNTNFECRACDSQCQGCTGPGNTDCQQCSRVNSTENGMTTCLQSCPEGTYESDSRLCVSCHEQCSGGCTGATRRDCNSCREVTVQLSGGETECVPECPLGMVYETTSETCLLSS